jgi:hypothetical protein
VSGREVHGRLVGHLRALTLLEVAWSNEHEREHGSRERDDCAHEQDPVETRDEGIARCDGEEALGAVRSACRGR